LLIRAKTKAEVELESR